MGCRGAVRGGGGAAPGTQSGHWAVVCSGMHNAFLFRRTCSHNQQPASTLPPRRSHVPYISHINMPDWTWKFNVDASGALNYACKSICLADVRKKVELWQEINRFHADLPLSGMACASDAKTTRETFGDNINSLRCKITNVWLQCC